VLQERESLLFVKGSILTIGSLVPAVCTTILNFKNNNLRINLILMLASVTMLKWKTISITYSEFVSVVLVIQHAVRMYGTTLQSVVCMALLHVCKLSHKGRIFRKILLNTKRFDFRSNSA
jgi:hypothetical protein